ncbi:hypothetical protein [Aureliella helgolandensis]|uniref:LemA family protein n=1 Tax=Aureliella helgolandensis TaxID=2527968 RepID=A0A518G2E9_9BACT|nr:hypothetical protein [Aureliella helgolandensis]QDV22768.1 hypothetical protein Q31a_10590 [Aureliella helgolandensis]
MATANADDTPNTPPPGVSGRRITAIVILSLVVGGAFLSYELWSYNRLDAARAATQQAWRSLTDPLSQRYRKIELAVAERVDSESLDMAWAEKFRLTVDRFRTTALPDLQFQTSQELEELLSVSTLSPEVLQTENVQLADALRSYNRTLDQERQLLHSPACKFLGIFLKFNEPVELQLATTPQPE